MMNEAMTDTPQAPNPAAECEDRDFYSLLKAVDDIYPHARKYFKANRAFELDTSQDNIGKHLHKAIRVLVAFADTCAADPAYLARIKRLLPELEQDDRDFRAQRKAEQRAAKKAAKKAWRDAGAAR